MRRFGIINNLIMQLTKKQIEDFKRVENLITQAYGVFDLLTVDISITENPYLDDFDSSLLAAIRKIKLFNNSIK